MKLSSTTMFRSFLICHIMYKYNAFEKEMNNRSPKINELFINSTMVGLFNIQVSESRSMQIGLYYFTEEYFGVFVCQT